MTSLTTSTLIGVVVVLTLVAGLLVAWSSNREQQFVMSISNFDACVAAGFPIMESFPERCATLDGRTFVNERQQHSEDLRLQANGCAIAGCSGQLCVSADEAGEIVSTCEYRAEYACYGEASCEKQQDGKCGWTETSQFMRCLANPPEHDESLPQVY